MSETSLCLLVSSSVRTEAPVVVAALASRPNARHGTLLGRLQYSLVDLLRHSASLAQIRNILLALPSGVTIARSHKPRLIFCTFSRE
jgi:hypothetical protein